MKRKLLLCALLLSALYTNAQVVDSSFGVNGFLEVTMNLGYITVNKGSANAMAIQPDGKIVTGMDLMDPNGTHWYFQTRRYNTNGSPDTTFGTGGVADVFFGEDCVNEDLFVDTDGKIVAIGSGEYCINGVCGFRNLAMVRHKANGKVDSSFGVNGLLLTQDIFGGGHYCIPRRVKPAAGGKYIIAGQGIDGKTFIARLNHDGALDYSFGTTGVFSDTTAGSNLRDIVIDNNGNIFALVRRFNGAVTTANPQDQAVLKLTADGALVSSFGTNGTALFNFDKFEEPEAICLTGQGKIAIAGSVSSIYAWDDSATYGYVALLETNGSLTTSIPGGWRKFQYAGDTTLYFKGIQCLSNNGFLLNGISDTRDADGHTGWKAILFRANADLTADTSFNHNGWMRFNYGVTNNNSNTFSAFMTAKTLPNGDIIAGGYRNVVLNGKMGTFMLKLKNVPGAVTDVPAVLPSLAVNLYPNPAKDMITIESETPVRYTIVNVSGQTIATQQTTSTKHKIQLSQYAPGLYTVRLTDEHGVSETRSFIHQ